MLYKIVRLLALLFFKLFSRLRVEGNNQLPENEAFILAPNHFSTLDAFILLAAVKNEYYTIGKMELFKNPILKFFIIRFNAIPVNREGFCRQTLKVAIEILGQNKIVAIFPEGYISKNGTLGRFKSGVARLALEAKVPVIPVAIIGSNRVLPLGKRIPRPHRVIVKFGEPIYVGNYEQGCDRKVMTDLTERVKQQIHILLNYQNCN